MAHAANDEALLLEGNFPGNEEASPGVYPERGEIGHGRS